jgi:hypothetical protein
MQLRPVLLVALALVLASWWALLRDPRAPSAPPAPPPLAATGPAAAPGSPAAPAPSAPAPSSGAPTGSPGSPPPAPTTAATSAPAAAPAAAEPPPRSVADILQRAGDLTDPAARERAVAAMRTLQQERRILAQERARALGLPLRTVGPKGRVREVVDLDDQGQLVYRTTFNVNAARTSGASLLQAETPPLTGSGVTVGVWDAGQVRSAHQELTGRVTVKDSADTNTTVDDHSTHVGGTIGASGVVAAAKGMAPAVAIFSYDWNSDYTEMTAIGATAGGQSTKIYLSNHSYGTVNGWDYTGNTTPMWIWNGTGTGTTGADAGFGQYSTDARDADAVVYSTPYLLPFWAAGNDGTDDPVNGDSVQLNPSVSTYVSYNSATHPAGDGQYRGGYDTIASGSIGKNVLTVGATTDAVTGTARDITKATLVDFSSVGPTDDGRIKPDLVANGDNLYSSVGFNVTTGSASNTAYDTYSGTSMATPSAAGSAALLVQLYGQLFPSGAMRASTLKGLLIHTADDIGTAGPDYKNGWGLLNVKAAADLLRDHAANSAKLRLNEGVINNSTTTTVTYDFTWDGTSPIRATLCWTDPAGTATTTLDSRTSRLVNNLDLAITGPDSSTHQPYVMPFVGTWTQASMALAATRGLNSTDNVEQVYIAAPPAAGTYRATVSFRGTLTNNSQNFSLLISGSTAAAPEPAAPTITTHPVSQSVALGGSATFSVAASGTTPFTYQWRKNSQPITSATNATLTLTNVQTTDAGSYDVVVTNSLGSATSNAATLSIVTVTALNWNFTTSAAPSSTLPAGVTGGTVAQGNNVGSTTALLDATAASSGYTGASGGNNAGLGARTGALNTATGGSSYYTFTLTPDTGKRLVVSGISFATRRSSTGPQAWALYSSADNYATALATGAVPTASTWVLFTPTLSAVNGALSTPLTFRLYGYNGSGSYTGGSANFRLDDLAVTLAVQTAPVITTAPAAQTVAVGSDATFTVAATGTDPLAYQWRRNGSTLTGVTTASYTITNAQTTDAASYDVVVTNAAGSATSAAATLTVLSGFDGWLLGYFNTTERADPLISGPSVVLSGDGLTNLMKYALGLNPRVAATSGLPVTSATATHWTYTYTRPADRSDLTYTVQASTNLTDWELITITPTKIATADGLETWQAEYPLAGTPNLFFRLRVVKP